MHFHIANIPVERDSQTKVPNRQPFLPKMDTKYKVGVVLDIVASPGTPQHSQVVSHASTKDQRPPYMSILETT